MCDVISLAVTVDGYEYMVKASHIGLLVDFGIGAALDALLGCMDLDRCLENRSILSDIPNLKT